MAMSERTKKALTYGGAAAAVLALVGVASASGGDDGGTDTIIDPPPRDPDCPRGFHRNMQGGPCVPDDLPPPTTRKSKDYVGSGYVWPRKDLFPTEASFVTALEYLGYPVEQGWDVLSGVFMQKVGWFQADYNKVVKYLGRDAKLLATDMLIGKNTIGALVNAERWEEEELKDWQELVEAARLAA